MKLFSNKFVPITSSFKFIVSKDKDMTTNFKSIIQVLDFLKEDAVWVEYLKFQRWGIAAPSCPYCGSAKKAYVTNRGYKCSDKDCYKKVLRYFRNDL